MKIGVFSGTFDPVHLGHIGAAQQAIQEYDLDKVLFVPEEQPRLKSNVTAMVYRREMLEIATAAESNIEVWLAKQPQHNQSTWGDIKKQFANDELFMIVGNDVLPKPDQWPDGTAVNNSQMKFIKIIRSPESSKAIRKYAKKGQLPQDQLQASVLAYIKNHSLYM